MADDRHYVPGTFYRICDMSGFKVRSYDSRKEWKDLIVKTKFWEARQPQDFVTGVRDDQTVPDPRPRQQNQFINSTGDATFCVFGDLPYKTFLVQNTLGFDPGINAASDYTNPGGTAQFFVYAGLVPPVTINVIEQQIPSQ